VTRSRDLTVEQTATNLRFDATQINQTDIQITGDLTTESGSALRNRTLELTIAETETQLIQTNQSGEFNTTLALPAEEASTSLPFRTHDVPIAVAYDATGTSFEPATTTHTIPYSLPLSQSLRQLGYGVAAIGVLVGGIFVWRRKTTTAEVTDESPDQVATEPGSTVDAVDRRGASTPTELLDTAETFQSDGQLNEAVRLGYAALRWTYVNQYDLSPALTHRELTHELEERLDESDAALLFSVTTAYERAIYTAHSDTVASNDVAAMLSNIRNTID